MHDVIVIGGGPGGYAAAIRASQLGGQVAVIEAGDVGGTCVNRGCIPTKIWMRAAYLLHQIRRAEEFGIKAAVETVDLSAIVGRKDGVAGDIRMGMEALLGNNKVKLIRGRGVLKKPGLVDVDGQAVEAEKIILATGSSLDIPDVPGLDGALLTTDQAVGLAELPASVLVWGGGPIEVEMAACLNVFGCQVVLAAGESRILVREDHDTSQRLTQALREQGVEVLTGMSLDSIEASGSAFKARMSGAQPREVEIERVLVGGRKPNVEGFGLEALGVKLNDEGGIQVDDRLLTSVPGIYAVGDATGGWMLSHAASAMGVTAAENAMGQSNTFAAQLVPRGLWTFPQVGSVGLSEEEAERQGHEVVVGDFPYSINGLAMARGEVDGAVKIITDEEYGEILGVHIVGAGATDLIGEAVMAMQLECTADELAHTIRMHPTFSECVMDAARDASGWALYLPRR
ncbi:MAG: dihydrolipoyl dehydrogenase [Proteobacteria bacterium]|nr:dihydrolipoyl dehydrogenase [Pseudomonadota bacterium]